MRSGRETRQVPSTAPPIIVEEKPICRLAIAEVIADLVGGRPPVFASTLAQARDTTGRPRSRLLLIDLFSIGFDFEGLKGLIADTGAAAIAIDDRPNPSFAALARLAGARGYTCKSYDVDRFRSVIRAVVEGGTHFPRRAPRAGEASLGLSPRQLDVLKCIGVGMSNQEIAGTLGITPGTVKLHIHAILRLTGTRNRTEAALIAGRFFATTIED